MVKYPLKGIPATLIFIEPAEAFTAYVKIVLLAGLVLSAPVILYQIWRFVAPALPIARRGAIIGWLVGALLLFGTGLLFSYYLALPAALNFLLRFGDRIAVPSISLGKYVAFFSALMLIGGVIFEIPLAMGFLAELGVVKTQSLKGKRSYTFLGILIVAGIITPTPDAFNMFLVALPMYALFEIGIFVAAAVEKRKNKAPIL
jgi:sec-independent protein translocase protein TatC